jgi:RHS repeat-associated protein
MQFEYNYEDQCTSAGYYNYGTKSVYTYDGLGRLKRRLDYTWSGSSWYQGAEIRYYWDGWLLVQERNGTTPVVSYTRGHDLSGSREGAGGIGGLLGRSTYASGAWGSHAFYHADANGNVTMLLRADQTHGASYKYDPFGRTISSSGPLASANTMRFSSKEWHEAAGIYYYGYRFYKPEWQRWMNRDPLGELGGLNLYEIVGNSPVRRIDPLGLMGLPHPTAENNVDWSKNFLNCGLRIKDEVWDEHGIGAANHDPNDGSARVAHCIAHCRIQRECPGSGALSWLGGFGKEVVDQFIKWGGSGGEGYDQKDMNANALGRQCGKKPGSCVDQCQDAYWNGQLN